MASAQRLFAENHPESVMRQKKIRCPGTGKKILLKIAKYVLKKRNVSDKLEGTGSYVNFLCKSFEAERCVRHGFFKLAFSIYLFAPVSAAVFPRAGLDGEKYCPSLRESGVLRMGRAGVCASDAGGGSAQLGLFAGV